jgi:hypothetical protein
MVPVKVSMGFSAAHLNATVTLSTWKDLYFTSQNPLPSRAEISERMVQWANAYGVYAQALEAKPQHCSIEVLVSRCKEIKRVMENSVNQLVDQDVDLADVIGPVLLQVEKIDLSDIFEPE